MWIIFIEKNVYKKTERVFVDNSFIAVNVRF